MDTIESPKVDDLIENKIDEILRRLYEEAEQHGLVDGGRDYQWGVHVASARHVSIDGMWLEFGVYRGRSICHFAKLTSETIYGFDSFEGLPEKWNDENPKGVFSLAGKIPDGAIAGSNDQNPGMYSTETNTVMQEWPSNVKLIKGWFDDSLPLFIEKYKRPVAFLHVDSDIYSSASTILTLLQNQIVPGTVICFDEMVNYQEFREHEIKAFAEFLLRTGYGYKPVVLQDLEYGIATFVITEKENQ